MIGKTLGPYEILEPLGAGGMGKVYRARDTKLDRHVAVKILPEDFANDYNRLRRFKQEAKLLAAMHHPNVAAVYDLDSARNTWYLAQEYIEGQTLYMLLKFGPLDIDTALDIARQVAAGLEAAHVKGIVHRDLKPSNIIVTADNIAKILDFGIAKPLGVEPLSSDSGAGATDSDPAETPTFTGANEPGAVMGTAGYMSPDQARGRQVDQRADIWAFGVVLYEMLTGKPAFEGDTMLDKLAHIIRGDIDWEAIPAATPPRIVGLLQRCMQRDPSRRLQHIGDARIEIEEVVDGSGDDAMKRFGATAGSLSGSMLGRGGTVLPWAVTAAALLVAAGAVWSTWANSASIPPPPVAASIVVGPGAEISPRPVPPFAVSPQGDRVAFVGDIVEEGVEHPLDHRRQLFVRGVDDFDAVPIDGTEGADAPFFSPDGDWVGFFTSDNRIMKASLAGGGVQQVADVWATSGGASWGRDGWIVFGMRFMSDGLLRVRHDGGEVEQISWPDTEDGEVEHAWPHHLPDVSGVLFTIYTDEGTELAILDETGSYETVSSPGGMARYLSTGHLLFSEAGRLMAAPFDLETRTVGDPVSVVDDVYFSPLGGQGYFDVGAANGMLVYVPGQPAVLERRLVWVDRDGGAEPVFERTASYAYPRISPDGLRVAVMESAAGLGDVFLVDVQRRAGSRLTTGDRDVMPVWSPDGERVVFASTRHGGPANLFTTRVDTAGVTEELYASDDTTWPRSWSPDGFIAFYVIRPETERDIWVLDTREAPEATPFLETEFNERAPMFSPDGRWIAYVSNFDGPDDVWVQPFPEGDRQYKVSIDGGSEPNWSRDGGELFYRRGDRMMAVMIDTEEEFFVGAPRELFVGHYATDDISGNQYYDVDPSGRFLMVSQEAESPPTQFNVILHWFRDLERRAPATGR